ncbi:hypothetical protein P9G84_22355 [Brevibacillus centrosporus]|uniref:phage tail assembly chaperone n=1 Tax=Brevibacillus centrosporus TaxID=54910 RepID=UPI000F0A8A51|nr:hypothetical protein [Brevibacillus centrosporus]MEC2131671.1 hypothetical protein [Brevibacillus centrosporus]RNB67322.1 hypothetical protein EDM55_19935 [Brevibacillus centrosporus]GED34034.1 hypothetical protein BCE02nite_51750 [Brevibacillus centrosporus]
MQPRMSYKDVEVNGRKFRVKKFPARVGSFMIIKLTAILAPMLASIKPSPSAKSVEDVNLENLDITGIMGHLSSVSEKDFTYIQDQALRVCFELLPAGPARVINEDGSFGIEDIEDDTATIMALTVHALGFNLSSFFQGSGLHGLVAGLISSRQG